MSHRPTPDSVTALVALLVLACLGFAVLPRTDAGGGVAQGAGPAAELEGPLVDDSHGRAAPTGEARDVSLPASLVPSLLDAALVPASLGGTRHARSPLVHTGAATRPLIALRPASFTQPQPVPQPE